MAQPYSYKYKYMGSIQGDLRTSIFCIAFNNFDLNHRDIFAYVAQHQALIHRLLPGGAVEPLQVYEDADVTEYFYACKWSVDPDTGAALLLLAGKKALVRVLDVSRGRLVHTFAGHGKEINDIAVHTSRPHLILTASDDESIRLWNIRSRTCVAIFSGEGGHRNKVLSLDFHPWDGHRFLSAGLDTAVKIWSLASLERLIEESEKARDGYLGGPEPPPGAAAVGSAGAGAGAAGGEAPVGGSRRTFPTRVVQQPLFSTLKVHNDYVDCVRWLGDLVLSKSVHDVITLWRPHGQAQHRRPPPLQQQQEGVAGSANGGPANNGPVNGGPANADHANGGPSGAGGSGDGVNGGFGGGKGGGGGNHVIDEDDEDGGSDPLGVDVVASRVTKITDFKLGESNRTWFVRFSSDVANNVLAVGNAKGRLFLFSPLTGNAAASQEPRAKLFDRKCSHVVRQTAVNWDGTTILAACDDGAVHRWDRQTESDADMEED